MSSPSDWQRIHPVYGVPIAAEQATEQPSTVFQAVRENQPLSKAPVKVSTWINANYFIWQMAAGLADSGTDQSWTEVFNYCLRPKWEEIQAKVNEIEPRFRFSLFIIPPPLCKAVVTHVRKGVDANKTFKIYGELAPANDLFNPKTSLDQNGIFGLWQFLAERGQSSSDEFDVVLTPWSRPSRTAYPAVPPPYSSVPPPPPSYWDAIADGARPPKSISPP